MKAVTLLCVGCCLLIASPGLGAVWVNEFDNFTGQDAAAVSNYTDTGGGNPGSYINLFNGAGSVPAGWLTQGDLGGGNKSAKFFNAQDGVNGRARFGTLLPPSMDLDGGIAVSWRMRLGTANPGRGAFQIAGTSTGQVNVGSPFNAFFLVRNSGGAGGNTTIDIQRNGGGLYSATGAPNTVNQLVLGSNLANEYHQWTAAVIRRPSDNRAYWKLWLDGNLLLFGGVAGSPLVDPDDGGPLGVEQFSFSSFSEGFNGLAANDPYIGLGDLNNQDIWDFEFDYVNHRDDGIAFFVPEPGCLAMLALGALALTGNRGRRRQLGLAR